MPAMGGYTASRTSTVSRPISQTEMRKAGSVFSSYGPKGKLGSVSTPTTGGGSTGGISASATSAAPSPGGATAVSGGSDIMDLYAAALKRLSTGGMSLEASLADIEEGKKQAIARGQQSLVSGGLSGTTVMGGVPVAAEKTAGRARLAARGEAESKYLTTLASYAAFAQRAQEAAADRVSAMQRLQMQISSQERLAEQNRPIPVSQSETGGPGYLSMYGGTSQDIPRTTVSGLGPTTAYSQQFPSIYGQGEAEEPVPNWAAA